MHSRLYTRVLNQHPWVHNCTALNSIYNTTGLVGVFGSAESGQAGDMVDVMCREMAAVAKDVSEGELERAKAAAVSSVLMNLESRAVVAEDIGRQVLTYGHRCGGRGGAGGVWALLWRWGGLQPRLQPCLSALPSC